MTSIKFLLICLLFVNILSSCTSNETYKRDLLSENINYINKACYELGEARDASAVKLLLKRALDPRMSTNIHYKGMSVNYCRLMALKKISGVDPGRSVNQFWPDTAATQFYLDWAVKQGYLKNKTEVDINFY